MRYHLLRADGTYSDSGEYPNQPAPTVDGVWVEGFPEDGTPKYVPVNVQALVESAFLSLLPAHIGQPYLTGELLREIATTKQAVDDFNRLGLYALAKAMIQSLTVPTEMAAAKQSLLNLYLEQPP